jgi:hypothetical protein
MKTEKDATELKYLLGSEEARKRFLIEGETHDEMWRECVDVIKAKPRQRGLFVGGTPLNEVV